MSLLENLESMLARGQDNALVHYGLGGEYLKLEEYQKAIEHLQKALTHDPNYSAAWKLLGQALAASNRNQEAIETYERGMKIAEDKGDKQTAREMKVFLKRLQK